MKILLSNILIFLAGIGLTLSAQTGEKTQKLKRADCFFGVHFDLHASEDITDAGKTLTYQMVDTFLTHVRPDFIQIDCKGHPGISSYPTEVGYHVKGFEKDPLRLFRDVTEKNNVALFMHFSGVWDGMVVKEHPEWAVIKANGARSAQKVSFFSPYLDTYMIPQLEELSGKYKVDGAWIDGECWAVEPDYGDASLRRFTEETGITEIPRKPSDSYYPEFMEYTRVLFREHLRKYVDAIHQFDPGFQITSNWSYSSMMPEKVETGVDYLSGDVTPQNGVYRSAFEARCLAPQGKPWDLMAWGFSWDGKDMPMSIKSAVQLKQEAAEIIAMGGGVQFYFQQNRDLSIKPWIAGMLENIGNFCRERQPFCHKAVSVPQIALVYPTASYRKNSTVPFSGSSSKLQGALYALLDGRQAVEILMEHHLRGRMKEYPLIVIPECDYLEAGFKKELSEYVISGGNLLLIGASTVLLFKEELGIISAEKRPEQIGFIAAKGKIGSLRSEMLDVTLSGSGEPLSFFYRGSDFCQPSQQPAASVNRLGKGRIAAVCFNAGTCYAEFKTFILRDFINEIADKLFPDKLVEVRGSNLVHVAVNKLNDRVYINLINTAGDHNGKNTIGYDEIPALTDIEVILQNGSKPNGIVLQPEGRSLDFSFSDGKYHVKLPVLRLHEILEVY
jgi:hypothetical protein